MKVTPFFLSSLLMLFIGNSNTLAQSQNNDNEKIKGLISKKLEYNKRFGFGYRIQLYNGNERLARSTKERFEIEFPNIYNKLEYNQPEWKVQVGNYKTKLEADKDIILFQEKFSGIIVIPLGK